jgi:predicted Zn-dependent protease with MMP-like domain
MERDKFEQLVEEALDRIPGEFLARLENVAIVVEDEPNEFQRKKIGLGENQLLFGLYEGVPQIRRGPRYGMVLPDKITIFQGPIEFFCQTDEEIKEKIKDTVWHEIAHHFGTNEERVREIEKNREK